LESSLLLSGHLNDHLHLEDVLEPLGEDEGDQVAQVEAAAARPAARVDVELLARFVSVEDRLEVSKWALLNGGNREGRRRNEPFGEEEAAPQERMGAMAGQLLHAFDELFGQSTTPKAC
jgi:hypothetical protein